MHYSICSRTQRHTRIKMRQRCAQSTAPPAGTAIRKVPTPEDVNCRQPITRPRKRQFTGSPVFALTIPTIRIRVRQTPRTAPTAMRPFGRAMCWSLLWLMQPGLSPHWFAALLMALTLGGCGRGARWPVSLGTAGCKNRIRNRGRLSCANYRRAGKLALSRPCN